MSRQLTPASTLENLKREARRWLKALHAGDDGARDRLARALASPPGIRPAGEPTLRQVQLALAREHGFDGWADLRRAVQRIEAGRDVAPRDAAVHELLRATLDRDVARVRAVLDEYPDIVSIAAEFPGHEGRRTALHHAGDDVELVRLLLERGADPNVRDEGDDAMPLHFAAERGDLDVVKLLIEHGADPVGEGTMHELNALGWAVCWDYAHNTEVAEYLLAHGARHTIHTAVALGDVDVIRDIVARQPAALETPMDRTNRRRRPLHLAVVKRRADVLQTLVELGADVGAEDAAGLTALDQAALDGASDLAAVMLERGAPLRLPAAIALERTADVERLLRDDPDALKPGGRWATLIVQAAARGSARLVSALLRAGASANSRDDVETAVDGTDGFTPLHAAAFHGNTAAVRVLLEHGADVNVRDSRWCGTPAGWADYAGHGDARDVILEADIDPFQAIEFDRPDRIAPVLQRSPWLREKTFGEYARCREGSDFWWPLPAHSPLVRAVLGNRIEAVQALLAQGALQPLAPDGRTLVQVARAEGHDDIATLLERYRRVENSPDTRVRWFVKNACPDHDIRGPADHAMARGTAVRLLRQYPDLATDSFTTAVICGDAARVERMLREQPGLAREAGGPKGWTPLLYLCFTRLPDLPTADVNAVAIATLLLDHGADPNAFFMAGDSRYTPLVGAIGEGEEDRPAHPRRDELVRLLLERGAEPYDIQVIYNIHFHGRVLWFLRLIHERSLRLGRAADWADPAWAMLDMGGYGNGARYHLDIAVKRNDVELARWLLEHGADPDEPPPEDPRFPKGSLYEAAVRRGHHELAELLVRHGAVRHDVALDDEEVFVDACMRLDRQRVQVLLVARPDLLQSPRAMHEAAKRNRADAIALLLELGASMEIANEKAQRPLHIAAWHDAVDVAELLISHGAAIDPVESEWRNTPLDFAVYGQHQRMIELLGRHSRDIWNLVYTGRVERVRAVLREEPALARVVTPEGQTPLTWLPEDEDAAVAMVELFLEAGAAAAVIDRHGLTAADRASRRGLAAAAALLRESGDV